MLVGDAINCCYIYVSIYEKKCPLKVKN